MMVMTRNALLWIAFSGLYSSMKHGNDANLGTSRCKHLHLSLREKKNEIVLINSIVSTPSFFGYADAVL